MPSGPIHKTNARSANNRAVVKPRIHQFRHFGVKFPNTFVLIELESELEGAGEPSRFRSDMVKRLPCQLLISLPTHKGANEKIYLDNSTK